MAAKKKEEKVVLPARNIDYVQIIDGFSEEAFKLCVKYLYPVYNYRILQESDIRRIDLKEQLLRLESDIPYSLSKKYKGILNVYCYMLKLYFEDSLPCKQDSRPQKFKDRASELMDRALSDEGKLEDIEDVFIIFISLFRVWEENDMLQEKVNRVIASFNPTVKVNDAQLVQDIWKCTNRIPDVFYEKAGLLEKKKKLKLWTSRATKIMYVNNIIFLCKALDDYGVLGQEDE